MTTAADKKLIDELFVTFDKDRSGKISVKELKRGLRVIGSNPTKKEINTILNEMNVKKGQEISREQFNRCMMRYCDSWRKNKETADDELLSSFRLFDKDNNGYIDPKELTRVLTGLGEKMKREEVQEMFKSADKNADGKIHYEEFVELFQNKHLEHVKKG